jgi:Na+/phosphate symporter
MKKKPDKHLLYLVTGVWFALVVLSLTSFNPPQCPDHYTQAQVDAAHCIVGANIGLGLVVFFVIVPLTALVAVLWAASLTHRRRKN